MQQKIQQKKLLYYVFFWMMIIFCCLSKIAGAIVINQKKFIELGGDLNDIPGTVATAYEELRLQSLSTPFLSVGTFIGKNNQVCTGTWVGNEGLNAIILTAAQCVYDNGTETTTGEYEFKSYDDKTIAKGFSKAHFPPDHVEQPDHGFDGASTDITLVKMPLKSFLITDDGLVEQPIINDVGDDTFRNVGLLGVGYWGVGNLVDPSFRPITGLRRALGNSRSGTKFADDRGLTSYYFPDTETVYWSRGDEEDTGGAWFQVINGYSVISAVMSTTDVQAQSLGARATYYSHWIKGTFPGVRLLSEVEDSSQPVVVPGGYFSNIGLPQHRDPVPSANKPSDMPSLPSGKIYKYGDGVRTSIFKRSMAVFSASGSSNDTRYYSLERINPGYGELPQGSEDNEWFDFITHRYDKAQTWIKAHSMMEKPVRDGRNHYGGHLYVFVNPSSNGTPATRLEAWELQQSYGNDLPAIPLNQTSKFPWHYHGTITSEDDAVDITARYWAKNNFNQWGDNDQHGGRCLVVAQVMPWNRGNGQVTAYQLTRDATQVSYGSLPGCASCSSDWWTKIGEGRTGEFAQNANNLETICRRTKSWGDVGVRGDLFLAYQNSKQVLFMYRNQQPSSDYPAFPSSGSSETWERIISRNRLSPKELEWALSVADAMVWSTCWSCEGGKDSLHYYLNPFHVEEGLARLDIFKKKKDGDPQQAQAWFPTDRGDNDWWEYLAGDIRAAVIRIFKETHQIKEFGEQGEVGDLFFREVNDQLYFYRLWFKDSETSLGYGVFPSTSGEPQNQWWKLAGKSLNEAIVANKLLEVAKSFSQSLEGNIGDLYYFYNSEKEYALEFFILLKSPYEDFPTDGVSDNEWWQRAKLSDFITMEEAEDFNKDGVIIFSTQKEIDQAISPEFLRKTFMFFNKIEVDVSNSAWASSFILPSVGFDSEVFTIDRTSDTSTSVDLGKSYIYSPEKNERKSFIFKRYDDQTFFGDWIPNDELVITSQSAMELYLETPQKIRKLYENYSFIGVTVSNSAWVKEIVLPDDARKGQFMHLIVNSNADVRVSYSGSLDILSKEDDVTYTHNGQRWEKQINH